ncbi:hypothetical protein BGX33_007366 [Mortierella sp. NVP41]|nr:hypothetical protein BGX33_007366 [Mortierella sp. NVP41]
MAEPYASAAIWRTFIQQPNIVSLDTLVKQVQEVRQTNPGFKIPTMKVYKDCFHPDLREQATNMLGIVFSSADSSSVSPSSLSSNNSSSTSSTSSNNSRSDYIPMTVLQLSIMSLYVSLPEDADQREAAVEMLVQVFSSDEISGNLFGDRSNVLHLTAFLNMESTLHLLIAYGGDPLLENGCGLSAFDILFAVQTVGFDLPSFQAQKGESRSIRNSVVPCTLSRSSTHSLPFLAPTTTNDTRRGNHSDDTDYHRAASVRSTAQYEFVGDSDSLELDLNDGPQVFQLTFDGNENGAMDQAAPQDTPTRSFAFDSNVPLDGYGSGDPNEFNPSNSTAHLVERDAQDMDRQYYYQNDPEYQRYLREQHELDEIERRESQLHGDPACFLRIRHSGPMLTVSGALLVSILKNRQAWRPQNLSVEHAQSFEAYEAYTDRLQLQRKPDISSENNNHLRIHEKSVQWNHVKRVWVYQRHMNFQLETDSWDGPLVFEPYDEPVDDDEFVLTASPYDMVRPVTPSRPRSHSFSLTHNNSCLDLSTVVTDRTSSPAPQNVPRSLPEIAELVKSTKPSISDRRKGTPPPLSFLSKAIMTVTEISSAGVVTQVDDSAKSSSLSFSKRLSATSLLWSPKRPGSPFAKMSFSASEQQPRSPTLASDPEDVFSGSADVLGQESTEAPLVTDSSQWVPRMLRNLTSPSSSLSKTKGRISMDCCQPTLKTQPSDILFLQATSSLIGLNAPDHEGLSNSLASEDDFTRKDSISYYDSVGSSGSNEPTAIASTTTSTTSKVFAQLKSALREKFTAPSFPPRAPSPIPRCRSTPPILPPIPMTRSLSESPSPTGTFGHGFREFPTGDTFLDRSNSNSSTSNDVSIGDDDSDESDKALTTLQQRRLSLSAISGDQLDTIRAHIPRATSPLSKVSNARSATRSPQLYHPAESSSDSGEEDLTAALSQDSPPSTGLRFDNGVLQEFSPPTFQPMDRRRLSLTGVAMQFLDTNSTPIHSSRQEIQEDPNRPALPERPPSRSASSSSSLSSSQAPPMSIGDPNVPPPRREISATSSTRHTDWKKRKEVAVVHPLRTSSLPPGSPSEDPIYQDIDLSSEVEELAVEEIPAGGIDDSAEAEVFDTNAMSESNSGPLDCSAVAVVSHFQRKDSQAKNYQDMFVKSKERRAHTKALYVIPALNSSDTSIVKMEYVHGITHQSSSALVDDPQANSKNSTIGAALVNFHGISRGLEVQSYNLRQSVMVERYSDIDRSSSTRQSSVELILQPLHQERYASLWVDVTEFESRPRRSTLSNCESPMTTQTGVLYLRLKKVCNFSLPLPGENTMVSIRIDTGYEKVDTDYVPLEDVDMIFNQEFCLPVCPGLAITITLHLMQAPHLQPRYIQQHLSIAYSSQPFSGSSNSGHSTEDDVLDRSSSVSPCMTRSLPVPPQQQHAPTPASTFHSIGKTHGTNEAQQKSGGGAFAKLKGILTVRKKNRTQKQTPQAASSSTVDSVTPSQPTTAPTMQQPPVDQDQWLSYWKELGEQHKKGSIGSNSSQSFLRSLVVGANNSSATSSTTAATTPMSSSSTSPLPGSAFVSSTKAAVNNRTTTATATSTSDVDSTTDGQDVVTTVVPFLPQLTQAQIRATETPLEILSRHILFDDELCIARTGIVFSEIRAACTNQIVNVEFQTVNNWVDLNDYSRVQGQLGRESPSTMAKDTLRCSSPASGEKAGEDKEEEGAHRDAMVANIQTTVCFIPGPEMDPEDAIFEEQQQEGRLPSEPQNLVDCHVGLKYFHWQNRVSFRGELFYMAGSAGQGQRPQVWRQGWFCIVGSVLWQTRRNGHEQHSERWRCLDLSLVQGIETSLGYFNARARFLEEDEQYSSEEHQGGSIRVRDASEEYYPVRNGFRLCAAKEEKGTTTRFDVDFYTETTELGQCWVSALMEACRERPPRPYWLTAD